MYGMTKFDVNEVVEMKNKGKLLHVRKIWSNVNGYNSASGHKEMEKLYQVSDMTHTKVEYWRQEDFEEQFHSTGIKCNGKPKNQIKSLDHRME